MRIDSSGRVGIGLTGTNSVKLGITGNSGLPATSGTTQTGLLRLKASNNATLDMGADHINAVGWLQVTDVADLSNEYNLLLQPNGGNVGIGIASPAAGRNLHIAGSSTAIARIEATATNGEPTLELYGKNSSGTQRTFIAKYDNSDLFRIGTSQAVDIRFETNDTERMRIDSSGRVGIGKTPSDKLDVLGVVRTTNTVDPSFYGTLSNPDGLTHLSAFGGGTSLVFDTAGSERMRIDSSGNVGIGVSPSTKLTIDESSTAATNQIDLIGNNSLAKGHIGYFTNSVYLASNYFFRSGQNNDNATLGQASMVIAAEAGGGSFAFGTSSAGSTVTTQRVRIDNDGLKFNADTAAANALDDYEEGTFTPSLVYSTSGTPTYVNQLGRYTKVGRMVQVQIYLSWNENGALGNISITGFPFTSVMYSLARGIPSILIFRINRSSNCGINNRYTCK
jgi:hypothetical protein